MSLSKTLKTGALTGLMGLASLTGCSNTPEARQMKDALMKQIIFQSAAAELRKKGEYEKAQAMENIGNVMGNIDAQRAGRSEVNVNVNTNKGRRTQQLPENVVLSNRKYSPAQGYEWINKDNSDLRVRKKYDIDRKVPDFFMANYWKDLNENGIAEVEEIIGFFKGNKRDFNQGENVSFWVQNFDRGQGTLEFKIHNPKGEEIYSKTFPEEKGQSVIIPSLEGFSSNYFKNKGTHVAFYSIDRKFKESIQFNIH